MMKSSFSKSVYIILLLIYCSSMQSHATTSFFADGHMLTELAGAYSATENIGIWDESVLTPSGYLSYSKGITNIESLGSNHDADSENMLFFMSNDGQRYALIAVSKQSHLPMQIITQESKLKFDLCYLSDGVIEVSSENEAGVALFKTINFNREDIENQLNAKGYSSALMSAVFTTAMLCDGTLEDIPGLGTIINDFKQIVDLPYYPISASSITPIVDSRTNAYLYISMMTNWASELSVDLGQNIVLWTGESTFKVGGSSATLSGAVLCFSDQYQTMGTYGIVVDKSPENLTIDKADFVLQAKSNGQDHGFEVDVRGLDKQSTYYYRTYYRFNSDNHGNLHFKYPPADAPVGYGPTKSFTTLDNILTVDVVMCMDVSGSMTDEISMVKSNALSFYDQFKSRCDNNDIILSSLSVQVVQFRDINYDGTNALLRSSTYQLPNQKNQFNNYVKGIKASGGGNNVCESGLEALHLAITKDDWGPDDGFHRQVIVLWTDAPYIDGEGLSRFTTEQIKDLWDSMPSGRRMILFAPTGKTSSSFSGSWDNMDEWENVVHLTDITRGFSDMGSVLDDIIGELTNRGESAPKKSAPQIMIFQPN